MKFCPYFTHPLSDMGKFIRGKVFNVLFRNLMFTKTGAVKASLFYIHIFHIYFPIWVKFRVREQHIMLSRFYEFY